MWTLPTYFDFTWALITVTRTGRPDLSQQDEKLVINQHCVTKYHTYTSLFLPVEYLQKVKGLWKKPYWQLVYLASLVCTSWLVVKCPLTPQELFLILTVTVFTFFFDCTERAIYIIHDFKCITLQNLTLSEIKCVKILNTYDTQPKISLRI